MRIAVKARVALEAEELPLTVARVDEKGANDSRARNVFGDVWVQPICGGAVGNEAAADALLD